MLLSTLMLICIIILELTTVLDDLNKVCLFSKRGVIVFCLAIIALNIFVIDIAGVVSLYSSCAAITFFAYFYASSARSIKRVKTVLLMLFLTAATSAINYYLHEQEALLPLYGGLLVGIFSAGMMKELKVSIMLCVIVPLFAELISTGIDLYNFGLIILTLGSEKALLTQLIGICAAVLFRYALVKISLVKLVKKIPT